MTKYVVSKLRWLLLGSNPGSGLVANNAFGIFRTATGMPIELFILHVWLGQNLLGRIISAGFDQGTNIFFESWRLKLRAKFGITKGPKSWLFDTVYMTALKPTTYALSLWLAGIPPRTVGITFLLNLAMFVVTSAPNCALIDKLQKDNPKT